MADQSRNPGACLVWRACSAVETCRSTGYPWHPRWRAGLLCGWAGIWKSILFWWRWLSQDIEWKNTIYVKTMNDGLFIDKKYFHFILWLTAHYLAVIFNSDIDLCGKISFKPSIWCVYWIPCTQKHTFRHQKHLSSCIGSKSMRYYLNTLLIWRPSWIFIKFWSWTDAKFFCLIIYVLNYYNSFQINIKIWYFDLVFRRNNIGIRKLHFWWRPFWKSLRKKNTFAMEIQSETCQVLKSIEKLL